MTSCELNSLLGRYHDGELADAQRRQMEAHLARCAPCAAELEQLRRISQSLRHGAADTFPRASGEFLARLEALAPNVERQTVFRFVTRLTATAAALLVAATVLWALQRNQLSQPTAPNSTIASSDGSSSAAPLGVEEQAILDPDSAIAGVGNDSASAVSDSPLDVISQELSGGRQ